MIVRGLQNFVSLQECYEENNLTEYDILLIMKYLLNLLEYFDNCGIVHRGLDPRNIQVIRDDIDDI